MVDCEVVCSGDCCRIIYGIFQERRLMSRKNNGEVGLSGLSKARIISYVLAVFIHM
jgi:hypothetical protein